MNSMSSINVLRFFDEKGGCLFAVCRPEGSADLMKFADEGDEGEWCMDCHPGTSVIIDTSEPVQIVDPQAIRLMASWLTGAAGWLERKRIEEAGE